MLLTVRDRVRQLGLCKNIARDVLVVRRIVSQPRDSVVRVQDDHGLVEVLANDVHGTDKIGVSANQHKDIGLVIKGVEQHCGGDIDIGALLFELYNADHPVRGRLAGFAGVLVNWEPCRILAVVTLDDFNFWNGRKSLKIDFLTVKCGRIVRVGLNRRGEILQRFDFMIVAEKISDKQEWVNPLPRCPLDGPVVEIVSIEIDVCSLHDSPLKLQGPQPKAEALHRLDGVWRLDTHIVAKVFECKQVADFRKEAA